MSFKLTDLRMPVDWFPFWNSCLSPPLAAGISPPNGEPRNPINPPSLSLMAVICLLQCYDPLSSGGE